MTHLCVAIFVTDIAKAKREIALAAEAGADMVELRIDGVTDAEQARKIAASSFLPCIVTCRPTWEGGNSELPDAERVGLLEKAAQSDNAYIDVELETLQRLGIGGERVIVSAHDFTGRPGRLHNLIIEMNGSDAAVNKIVWTARTVRDNLEAFEILQHRQKPTIAFCMGEAG